jgi:hypothetical protein
MIPICSPNQMWGKANRSRAIPGFTVNRSCVYHRKSILCSVIPIALIKTTVQIGYYLVYYALHNISQVLFAMQNLDTYQFCASSQ